MPPQADTDASVFVVVLLLSISVIGGLLYYVWQLTKPPQDGGGQNDPVDDPEVDNRGLRRRNVDGPEGEEEPVVKTQNVRVVGKKKMLKMQRKEAAAQQRLAMEEQRKIDSAREDQEIEERLKRQRAEKKLEAESEAALAELRKARDDRDEKEYQQLKPSFSVDEEGEALSTDTNSKQFQEGLCTYIKAQKVVFLEDLAAMHSVSPQQISEVITKLEAEDSLNGILDEKGKFIVIEKAEFDQLSAFIKMRGRVSIADITAEANRILMLREPQPQEKPSASPIVPPGPPPS